MMFQSLFQLPSLPAPVGLPYQVAPAGDQSELDCIFETLKSLGWKQWQEFTKKKARIMGRRNGL